jgi:EAL domain-containing protein (putative c-di-GMP-specific phosphodiesterase class I)
VSLAHSLGMVVIAEGVETKYQATQIKAMGCDYAQGYFFSNPLDNTQAQQLLASATIIGADPRFK